MNEIHIPISPDKLTKRSKEISTYRQKKRLEKIEDYKMYVLAGFLLGLLVAFALFGLLD